MRVFGRPVYDCTLGMLSNPGAPGHGLRCRALRSNKYMSMTCSLPNNPEALLFREIWRRLFADLIEGMRHATGRKVRHAARLAGMEITEWLAIETGYKRPGAVEIDQMAPVLRMSRDQMSRLVHLCREAWPE